MKLSELQHLKQMLQQIDLRDLSTELEKVGNIQTPIDTGFYDKQPLVDAYYRTVADVKAIRYETDILIRDIDRDIPPLYEQYLKDSEAEDPVHTRAGVEANRELRTMRLLEDTERVIRGRIGNYANWAWPGLEIGPGDGYWTNHLVAFDPLYIVDVHQEFLDVTKANFNPAYQLRLRPYKIKDCDFSVLPKGQLGFVFAWNVFNYMSMNHIERLLTNLTPYLRPGAVLMFSYNNGDLYPSTKLAERGFATFVPNSRLVPMLHDLGFEVIRSMDMEFNISWMEIKRPGKLTSIRSGQTLGKIKQNLS